MIEKKPKHPNSIKQLEKSRLDLINKEEARKIQSLGGKQKQKNDKIKRNFQEMAQYLLGLPVSTSIGEDGQDLIKFIKQFYPDVKDEEITNRMLCCAVTLREGMKGNMKALEFFRDTAGEKPTDNIITTNNNINIASFTDDQVNSLAKLSQEDLEKILKKNEK